MKVGEIVLVKNPNKRLYWPFAKNASKISHTIEIENLMKDLKEENFDDSDSENEDEFENNEVDFDQKVESLFAWKEVEGSLIVVIQFIAIF
ncbi:hypothetical protein TNCV_826481 [Trichonephila clavipes]|nr:hypothetical protein TNCV_826481 [Trichonephila clavipes]